MSSPKRAVVWNEGDVRGSKSFVGNLQMFSEKSRTKLESPPLVEYPVHVVFVNGSAKHYLWLMENRHSVVMFLTVMEGSDLNDSCFIRERLLTVHWFQAQMTLLSRKHGNFSHR